MIRILTGYNENYWTLRHILMSMIIFGQKIYYNLFCVISKQWNLKISITSVFFSSKRKLKKKKVVSTGVDVINLTQSIFKRNVQVFFEGTK